MKDGEFDRLRIPVGDDSGGPSEGDTSDALDDEGVAFPARTGLGPAPAQLAVGSAVVAGLILLGVAALRRRRGGPSPTVDD